MPLTWDGFWLGDGKAIAGSRLSFRTLVSMLAAEGVWEVVVSSLAEFLRGMPSSSAPISSALSTMARFEVPKIIWSPRVRYAVAASMIPNPNTGTRLNMSFQQGACGHGPYKTQR